LPAGFEDDGFRLFLVAATTATIAREVEAATNAVDSGSLGSFFGVSVSKTTGASKLSVLTHDL